MLKTQKSVEKSAKAREDLAEEIRAVGALAEDAGDGRAAISRKVVHGWARRVEECKWGSSVLMTPRDRNDVPLLLGDFVRREKDGVTGEVRRISFRKERDAYTTTVEIYTTRLGTVFCAPCDLEHASASPQERIREWVRRANADEHMDLRELTDIANDMDAEAMK